MNWSDPIESPDDLRIEAYVDGELTGEALAAFEAELSLDAELGTHLEFARDLRRSLRRIPPERLPAPITASVLGAARREARSEWLARARAWLLPGFQGAWQPALAVAVLAFLIVLSVRIGAPASSQDPAVAEALDQVKWTLAFLSEVGSDAGDTVRGTVIGHHVISPIQGAVDQVFAGPALRN